MCASTKGGRFGCKYAEPTYSYSYHDIGGMKVACQYQKITVQEKVECVHFKPSKLLK